MLFVAGIKSGSLYSNRVAEQWRGYGGVNIIDALRIDYRVQTRVSGLCVYIGS